VAASRAARIAKQAAATAAAPPAAAVEPPAPKVLTLKDSRAAPASVPPTARVRMSPLGTPTRRISTLRNNAPAATAWQRADP
jgi:hypothetical protein